MARIAILLNIFPIFAFADMDVSLITNYVRDRRCEAFVESSPRPLLLVVGLGNVGLEGTRHNLGFEILDHLIQESAAVTLSVNDHWLSLTADSEQEAQEYVDFSGASSPRREGLQVHYRVGGELALTNTDAPMWPVLFVKPRYDINESGHFVAALMNELGLKPENLLVVVDDLQLARNQVVLSQGKADASNDRHNGLRSINSLLGRGDYWRLRVGISSPRQEGRDGSIVDWVLGPLPSDDREQLLADDAPWLIRTLILNTHRRLIPGSNPQQLSDENKKVLDTLNGLLRP